LRRLQLLIALVAALVAGAGAGSFKGGSYGAASGRTSAASFQAGGAEAGRDTLLNVYSTRSDVAATMIANAVFDTFNTRWHNKKAIADRIVKLGVDDPTFAYAMLDTYNVGRTPWVGYSERAWELRLRAFGVGGVSYPTPTTTRWALTDSTGGGRHGRPFLVRFDPQIPAGSTIVSAKLHLFALNWASDALVDTTTATLMTAPEDSVWWRHKGINDNGSVSAPYMSKASYSYQWWATASSPNYGYTNASNGNTPSAQWKPALSTRARWWQYGSVSDWTIGSPLSYASGDYAIDITNCVQAISSGAENNGIFIEQKKNGTSDRFRRFYNFDQANGALERCYVPWIEIKYIDTPSPAKFPGGKDIAFIWQTDDGRKAFNDSLVTIFANNGGRFTAFVCDSLTVNSPSAANYSSVIGWHDSGVVEIGYHSWRHRTNGDNLYLAHFEKKGITAALMDTLRAEMNPERMYVKADALGRTDLRASPYWGKSFACPGYPYSATVIKVADEFGYNALRVGTIYPYPSAGGGGVQGGSLTLASWAKARSDTARAFMPYGWERRPRNVMLMPLTAEISEIVGAKANTTITEAQVRFNLRRLLRQAKAQNRQSVVLYEHDFKSGSYANGVDPEEMRWMLWEAVAQNAWICTVSDYVNWIKGGGTAVATPAGFAQPDSFRYTADDRLWITPHGINNRWIRGVK
jgi:hypothetical protein